MSERWVTDKKKRRQDTGEAVRFPIIPDADKSALPELVFPPRQFDDDGGWETGEDENFTIMIIYEDDTTETIPIAAIDADDALNRALEIREKDPRVKVKTTITHDGIGEVLATLKTGIEQYGAQALDYGGRAVAFGGRAARFGGRVVGGVGHIGGELARGVSIGAGRTVASYRTFQREFKTGKLERLMKDARSENPARRALARREIQMRFPGIYRHIAWRRV